MNSRSPPDPSSAPSLPSGQDLSLPWHLRLPGELEREFLRYFRETSSRLVKGSFYIIVLLFGIGSLLETLVVPEALELTWRARLLVVMALGAVYFVTHSDHYHRFLQPVMVATALILALSHDYMGTVISHPLDYFYFYINGLAILLLGTLFRVMMIWALPAALIILTGQSITMLLLSDYRADATLVALFFTTTVGTMSLFGQYFFERLQRRHFLSERVLSLHRTELHTANRMLESQATEDGLTGTVNRRGLENRLNSLFHARRRGGAQAPQRLSAILFDIDFFKQYNDTYGHQAGDDCLRDVARVPREMIQSQTDFIARYGGEEFMVVLVNTTMQDATVMAERMRARIEQLGLPHATSRVCDVVTISVGVASGDPALLTPERLIGMADEALYQAKEAGRNRVVCMDEQSGRIRVL